MEILPGIHSIVLPSGSFMGVYPPNVYLLTGRQPVLVDAGYDNEKEVNARLEYCRKAGAGQLRMVLVTHSHVDHVGGAEKIRAATGAAIAGLVPDAAAGVVDRKLRDDERLAFDGTEVKVVATPGHSRSHVCLLRLPDRVLFSGDHILGMGTTAIIPPDGDMTDYIASLRKLLALDIHVICPGHGPVIKDPRRKINELIVHRLEREQQVIQGLRQGFDQVEQLVQAIYPELDGRLLAMARGQVSAHLRKLEKEGLVASSSADGKEGYVLR